LTQKFVYFFKKGKLKLKIDGMLINKFVISKLSGQFVLGFIDKEDILMEGL